MIVYRAEIWCNGCGAPYGKGVAHSDPSELETQAVASLEEVAVKAGMWSKDGRQHFCVVCQSKFPPASVLSIPAAQE